MELLKKAFNARYADHRLVASMIGNLTVYAALTEPGDVIMTGTPEGVGPMEPGDTIEIEIGGVGVLQNPVDVRA